MLRNAPTVLNAFVIGLEGLISQLAYGLVVTQIDETERKMKRVKNILYTKYSLVWSKDP